jgi:2-C-methyl-D-erythritol 4-phosphate cytidylyltransferase
MGAGVPKQFLLLGGRPLLDYSIRTFLDHPEVGSVIVVLSPDTAASPPPWLTQREVLVVAGGRERGDSVWAGLQATPDGADPVLIHDGARPFVSPAVIERVVRRARQGVGAVAAVPVADTVKRVEGGGRIVSTVDRSNLWHAQTPQAFPRASILNAYRRARLEGILATDDASLVEHFGGAVEVVEGAVENFKVTRPGDLVIAEALASQILTD